MGNFGFQKPTKTGLLNTGATTVGAIGGYETYDYAVQRLPITKEMNAGIFGASVLGASSIKGSSSLKKMATGLLIGIAINSGITAAEDYGFIKRSVTQSNNTSLKGLSSYDEIVSPVVYTGAELDRTYRLSGVGYEADLM